MTKTMAVVGALVLLLAPSGARAEVFNVASEAEFRAALTTAAANGQDDTINVAAGTMTVAAPLVYLPITSENFALSIVGVTEVTGPIASGPHLVGDLSDRILDISTLPVAGDAAANVRVRGLGFSNGRGAAGGALVIQTASAGVTLMDSAFSMNASLGDGGGCFIRANGEISVVRNVFAFNTAGNDGGGLRVVSGGASLVHLRDNEFSNNGANRDGGGARVETAGGTFALVNNVFSGNRTTTGDGGGLRAESVNGAVIATNNTLAGNAAALSGGGVIVKLTENSASADLSNNIVFANTATGPLGGGDVFLDNDPGNDGIGSPVTLSNNDLTSIAAVVPASVVEANTISAPCLSSATPRLPFDGGVPCINAGSNAAPWLPTHDIDGELRILDGIVDIGADEFSGGRKALLSLVARPRRIRRGGISVLQGTLTDIAGVALVGRTVQIYGRLGFSRNARTGSRGGYRSAVRLFRTAGFRATFADPGQSAVSPKVKVIVRSPRRSP